MKRALFLILSGLLFALPVAAASQARNIEMIDVPTANTLLKTEIRYEAKFYAGGCILNKFYIGIFDRFMLGTAINVTNLIGSSNLNVLLPLKVAGKFRITDDVDAIPAIALGYEGEGYLTTGAKGVYLAVTKEIPLGGIYIQLTGNVYTNEFTKFGTKINTAAGVGFALTKEFLITGEFDGITGNNYGRINFGIGYFFDPVQIEIGIKYGIGKKDPGLSRILNINYVSYL
ncbi:MAG: hypothetical protein WCJ46_02005 [bacterium]